MSFWTPTITKPKKKAPSTEKKLSRGQKWWAWLSDEEKEKYTLDKKAREEELSKHFDTSMKHIEWLFEKIETLTPEQLSDMYKDMTSFHQYSTKNNLMIRIQKRDATTVWSRKKWYSYGYKVKPWAKKIHVLTPVSKVVFSHDCTAWEYSIVQKSKAGLLLFKKKNDIKLNFSKDDFTKQKDGSYKLLIRKTTAQFTDQGVIFDISDVEPIIKDGESQAKSLNDFTVSSNVDYKSLCDGITKEFGFEIEEVSKEVECWGFVVVWDNKKIRLNKYLDEKAKAWALIHEACHLLLWHTDEDHNKADVLSNEYDVQYASDEVQAETMAYLIRDLIGIESQSKRYLHWYKKIAERWGVDIKEVFTQSVKMFDIHRNTFKKFS